jgi:hypothetical protein
MVLRKSELSTTQHQFFKLNDAALVAERGDKSKWGGGPISDQIEYHAYAYFDPRLPLTR